MFAINDSIENWKKKHWSEQVNETKIVRIKDHKQVHHWRNRTSFNVLQKKFVANFECYDQCCMGILFLIYILG
jgi:hypothetical protein